MTTTATIRWLQSYERQARAMAKEFQSIAASVDKRPVKAPRTVEQLTSIAALLLTAADDMEDLQTAEAQR